MAHTWQHATPTKQPDARKNFLRKAYLMTALEIDDYLRQAKVAPLGLKKLAGAAYRLEKLDPKHRFGDMLFRLWQIYLHDADASWPPFFAWVDTLTADQARNYLGEQLFQAWQSGVGVTYASDLFRVRYRVIVNAGRISWRGEADYPTLLTTKGSSAMGTKSAYLWILDRTDEAYTDKSEYGVTHHSTFARGRAIRGAGEWQVEDGRVKLITGKTGHYRVGTDLFVEALRILRDRKGIDMSAAQVLVYENTKEQSFGVNDYLANRSLQTSHMLFPQQGSPFYK